MSAKTPAAPPKRVGRPARASRDDFLATGLRLLVESVQQQRAAKSGRLLEIIDVSLEDVLHATAYAKGDSRPLNAPSLYRHWPSYDTFLLDVLYAFYGIPGGEPLTGDPTIDLYLRQMHAPPVSTGDSAESRVASLAEQYSHRLSLRGRLHLGLHGLDTPAIKALLRGDFDHTVQQFTPALQKILNDDLRLASPDLGPAPVQRLCEIMLSTVQGFALTGLVGHPLLSVYVGHAAWATVQNSTARNTAVAPKDAPHVRATSHAIANVSADSHETKPHRPSEYNRYQAVLEALRCLDGATNKHRDFACIQAANMAALGEPSDAFAGLRYHDKHAQEPRVAAGLLREAGYDTLLLPAFLDDRRIAPRLKTAWRVLDAQIVEDMFNPHHPLISPVLMALEALMAGLSCSEIDTLWADDNWPDFADLQALAALRRGGTTNQT